jgi:hypothetical protein
LSRKVYFLRQKFSLFAQLEKVSQKSKHLPFRDSDNKPYVINTILEIPVILKIKLYIEQKHQLFAYDILSKTDREIHSLNHEEKSQVTL